MLLIVGGLNVKPVLSKVKASTHYMIRGRITPRPVLWRMRDTPRVQVLQSRDWLVGPLVRIWHVESSQLVVDLDGAFAMAKCKLRMRQSWGSAVCLCSVRYNADNSIKIAFTNSELPKIICTLFTSAHFKKNLEKTDERAGKGWPLTAPWKLSALFWNCVHKSEVYQSRCGYYADNCSIEKVRITLVPFRFYDQIMRILSA